MNMFRVDIYTARSYCVAYIVTIGVCLLLVLCSQLNIWFQPFNPLTAKLFNLNFHRLEVMSR